MAILDFNLSDAVRQALDRHEARRLETNQHFDSALENLGEAAKNAYSHYTRRKQMDAFGGDDNDGELRAAKDIYIKTGDISQLNAWKQNKAQQEQTAAINKQTALAEEKARQEKLNSDIADATADYENAAAKIRDASKGGATPSEVDKTAYNLAARKLKSLGKEVPSYEEYVGTGSDKRVNDLQRNRRTLERILIDAGADNKEIDTDKLTQSLEELFDSGNMEPSDYKKLRTDIQNHNKNLAKALQSEADAEESRKRGEIAYQQQQADRAEAKKKEREEEEKKKSEEERIKKIADSRESTLKELKEKGETLKITNMLDSESKEVREELKRRGW